MALHFEEILSKDNLLDYVENYPEDNGDLSSLFPRRKIDGYEADMVFADYERKTAAQLYAPDTPTKISQRREYKSGKVSMELIKAKMQLNEKDILNLSKPRSDEEVAYIINHIYNDVGNVIDEINTRIEMLRCEAFTTGKLEIKEENGYTASVDFGVPSNHKDTLTGWDDPDHDVLEDMYKIKEQIKKDTGREIKHMYTSEKWLLKLLKNNVIKSAMLGTEKERYITISQLQSALREMDLMDIRCDDRYREIATVKNKRVVREFVRFTPEDLIVFAPDGTMGETLVGDTASMLGDNSFGNVSVTSSGGICLVRYTEPDPRAWYVRGEAAAMVTFPKADQIYLATMQES